MSLQDVRVKLETGLDDIYTALEEKEATIPVQKNLVNVAPAIRSITGGGGVNQVVNYTMLYDGSLGSAGKNGANLCSEVTGGYAEITDSAYEKGTVTFNSNNLYLYASKPPTGLNYISCVSTENLINTSSYSKIGVLATASYESFDLCRTLVSLKNDFSIDYNEDNTLATIIDRDIVEENSLNGIKHLFVKDISNISSAYLGLRLLSLGSTGKAKTELKVYATYLFKQDNFQQILDLAGITTTYTEEANAEVEEATNEATEEVSEDATF